MGEARVPDAGKDMLSWEQPGDKGVCGAGGSQSHDAGWEAEIWEGRLLFLRALLLLPSRADRERRGRSVKGPQLSPSADHGPLKVGITGEGRWIPLTNAPHVQPSGRL